MTERQERILKDVIVEYIDSARPISSQSIEKKHGFDFCSATIRHEMQQLTELGFLYQPHVSAGRIPTDKAYRFFVKDLLKKEKSTQKESLEIKKILEDEKQDILNFTNSLLKFLTEKSLSLVTINLLEEEFFWKDGWGGILREPESRERDFTNEFINLLDIFEKDVRSFEINTKIKIYIGDENPFTKADGFSIIVSKCLFPNKKQGIISLFGPKRMKYKSNINLINSILDVLEQDNYD